MRVPSKGANGGEAWPPMEGASKDAGSRGVRASKGANIQYMAPYGAEDSPPQIMVGYDATPEQRGVEHICPGCDGGMGEGEELCGSCRYAADEREGIQMDDGAV